MQPISRACWLLATAVPLALSGACSDPELASELDADGPPEVLEVNVASESAPADPNGNAIEAAAFCRPGDEFKVNTLYCPLRRNGENKPIAGARELAEPLLDATPIGWHARFIFSELLDPSIEALIEEDGVVTGSLAESQPFALTCDGAEVAYDGWLDPTGNHLSYPPGPSLVVRPLEFTATGTMCEVSLREGVVTDKDGEAVPGDHLGPYSFGIAVMAIGEPDPADGTEGVDPAAPISIPFNAPVDLDSVAGSIVVEGGEAAVELELGYATDPETGEVADESVVVATPVGGLAAGTTYTVTVSAGEITDIAQGPLAEGISFSFTTAE
jgi:hypothetical protein